MKEKNNLEMATFGAGCFWQVEEDFHHLKGVRETDVGYMGGTLEDPTYEDVCTDETGHAEVVQVKFDPKEITYDQLLNTFWEKHDPTTPNRQGVDVGTQYRSVIFFHNKEQEKTAHAAKEKLDKSGKFKDPIVTEIVPAKTFYRAEEYHQEYLHKRGLSSCQVSYS